MMEEEKVPILGINRHRLAIDGVGVTTLVTLRSCPLRCKYCINDDCHIIPKNGYMLTASQVVEKCRIDNLYFVYTDGGITVGGGEALLHPRFICELRAAMLDTWTLNLETSLNVPRESVEKVVDKVSYWIIDVKDMNPDIYKAYTERDNVKTLDNLRYLASKGLQSKCLLRLPLIPDYNTDEDRQKSQSELQQLGFTDFDLFDYILPSEFRGSGL